MPDTHPPARLLVGPLLRYVDSHDATVWVEADRPCEVEVLGRRTPTWTVHGHHYALVQLRDLTPGTTTAYQVHLDGAQVWPPPDSPWPDSVVRTPGPQGGVRLAFGSCRRSAPIDAAGLREFGADAMAAMALRMAGDDDRDGWPDALFLLGDQVYADMPSRALGSRLARAHANPDPGHQAVRHEIWDFEEYTWLYHEAWTSPAVRWLLSTVPSCMLLDDHDLRDDWNTSASWRADVTAQPWWRDRVVGAFASYWVYQHLGNLSPAELDVDETFTMVRQTSDDAERDRLLDEFAWRSDAEPTSARWSFSRDLGGEGVSVRLLAVDSRCSRRLDPDDRAMVDDVEWDWVTRTAAEPGPHGPVDHLLVGSTLPFLMPRGVHHLEGWNEAVAAGAWGSRAAPLAERMRQAVDLEHWAAFRASLHAVVEMLERLVGAPRPPASVLMLSGDVHCSYTAPAHLTLREHPGTAVAQLTMSPFRNPLHLPLRIANRVLETRPVRVLARALGRSAGVADVGLGWHLDGGPWFDNGVMTVVLTGRTARVEVEHARVRGQLQVLERTADLVLTPQVAA